MNSTPEAEFDSWFEEDRGGTGDFELESDVDECFYEHGDLSNDNKYDDF